MENGFGKYAKKGCIYDKCNKITMNRSPNQK